MAQKLLNGVHISGATRLDFMPTHESEGIITLGRYDSNTTRYHNIKSYVSSTLASNYLKFSLHNGTESTVVDVLTLKGDGSATFAGTVTAPQVSLSTTSTTDSVLRLIDAGVIAYDWSFPDTGTIKLGVSATSTKTLKLINAGSGSFNIEASNLSGTNTGDQTLPTDFVSAANGGAFNGDVIINSAGDAASPVLRLNNSSSSPFNHALEALNANLTTTETELLLVGKSANSRNSGYIGFNWVADDSNSNYVSIGHWGYNHLLKIYPTGAAVFSGNVTSTSGTSLFSVVNTSAYQLNGTYIVDSSRNLVNISQLRFGGSDALIDTASTTSATATTIVATIAHATYSAIFFDFVIKNGTNVRAGTLAVCHDGTTVEYAETSTVDLGDTSDVTLSSNISGTAIRLIATSTSSTWTIKSLIRAI